MGYLFPRHDSTLMVRLILLSCLLTTACSPPAPPSTSEATPFDQAPVWAADVVWYQIFAERFRNGDASNDPTPADMHGAYPGFVPADWQITPWTHDWYAPDAYFDGLEARGDFNGNPVASFGQKAQLRRYGGDLQGVRDKIDYLDSLGVTAIYFNPLNDAPSLHKYDARSWLHIDPTFGPDPAGDRALIASETWDDPSTWTMTAADRMFVDVVSDFHARGIRVVLDYSWNHTGREHPAMQDVIAKGEASEYADWYWTEFDDPSTLTDEFSVQGWFGVFELPELRETVHHDATQGMEAYDGDLYSPSAREHIFAVTRRWLDPNGDGDPSDGVDGYRLDVAAEIGLDWWRAYRRVVREANPDALLIGEIWWDVWPDHLIHPDAFLAGDTFDAIMNYRWYRSARHFFASAPNALPASILADSLRAYLGDTAHPSMNHAMMNVAASHDTPRLLTSLYNRGRYKYHTKPDDDPAYRIDRPDARTFETARMLLAHQFTYVGAPHVWNGDEMGMWGADDPSPRKPLIWPDLAFEPETTHPLGLPRPTDSVRFDSDHHAYYQHLTRIRADYPALRRGEVDFVLTDDVRGLLGYTRTLDDETVLALFNTSDAPHTVTVATTSASSTDLLGNATSVTSMSDSVRVVLPARRAAILAAER